MTWYAEQLALMPLCPLNCGTPVPDPRQPCEECQAEFSANLRPADPDHTQSVEEFVEAERTGRERVLEVMAERAETVIAAGGWRRNQRCWCCDEKRTCHPDPNHRGERWICKKCEEIT
jgi:hypothetical protein